MRRAHVVLLSSASIVAAGVVVALAARAAQPTRPSLPPQAALLPADAHFIMGIDVPRFVASPLYRRLSGGPLQSPGLAWAEVQKWTGLSPERDFTQVIVASAARSADSGLALLLGRFDRGTVEAALANAAPRVSAREHKGRKLWTLEAPPGGKAQVLSVIDDGVLVAGSAVEVEAAVDRHEARAPGLTGNTALLALLEKTEPGAAFWMCGDQGLVSAVGNANAKTAGWTLPAVKTLVASGDLDPELRAVIRADTGDPTEAKKVGDMLRGLKSLVALQGAQRPEINALSAGVEITELGPEVTLAARLSYDTLAKLQATPAPAATVSPTPTPTARPRPRPTPSTP